eukprot:14362-Hanusia_phi.AAC.5
MVCSLSSSSFFSTILLGFPSSLPPNVLLPQYSARDRRAIRSGFSRRCCAVGLTACVTQANSGSLFAKIRKLSDKRTGNVAIEMLCGGPLTLKRNLRWERSA